MVSIAPLNQVVINYDMSEGCSEHSILERLLVTQTLAHQKDIEARCTNPANLHTLVKVEPYVAMEHASELRPLVFFVAVRMHRIVQKSPMNCRPDILHQHGHHHNDGS